MLCILLMHVYGWSDVDKSTSCYACGFSATDVSTGVPTIASKYLGQCVPSVIVLSSG